MNQSGPGNGRVWPKDGLWAFRANHRSSHRIFNF
jgi:hypothetical protein